MPGNRDCGKKPTAADKFSSLFDENWKAKASGMRSRRSTTIGYDPTYSWEGRTEGLKSFKKLDVTHIPTQHGRPVALSGATIIPLEENNNLSALGVRKDPHDQTDIIPLTIAQVDVDMMPNLQGHIPFRVDAQSKGSHVIMQNMEGFRNMQLQTQKLVLQEEPHFMQAAGSQANNCLLNPRQRRELLDFQKRNEAAERAMKLAISDRVRTKKQITGPNFRRGILMVESSSNELSEIYGPLARSQRQIQENKDQIRTERRSYLASKQSSITTNGNIIVPESIPSRVNINRDFQSKGGNSHALSFDETYNRVFERQTGDPPAVYRTQNIRNNDLGGRDYNFINHTVVADWPSRDITRLTNRSMMHPSQTSLENTRNLQGTLLPKTFAGLESRVF